MAGMGCVCMSIDIPSMLVGMKSGSPLGTDVRSFLIGKAVGGSPTPPAPTYDKWATDSWETIKAVSKAGLTAEAYGDQVGAMRDITLTDDTVMTLRLANATNDLYDRIGESGKTGLVVEFKDCISTRYKMNEANDNTGGWNACDMRTTAMDAVFDLLPSDLKVVIATVGVKTSNGGGNPHEIIVSSDRLFAPAEFEIFGVCTNSWSGEEDVLSRWGYYSVNDTADARIKKYESNNAGWALRSPDVNNTSGFAMTANTGTNATMRAGANRCVSPAFCI